MTNPEPLDGPMIEKQLRAPRAGAIAGIVFAVLLGVAELLINLATPSNLTVRGIWLTESSRRGTILVALNLIPFAGIAFLWFMGVIRDRLGQREDRFFATVFLGSGLLFIAVMFAGSAFAAGLLSDVTLRSGGSPSPDVIALGRRVTTLLLTTYGLRMAAVFSFSTATVILRARALPRWVGFTGYLVGVVLIVSVGLTAWVQLIFPAWILLLSIEVLRTGFKQPPNT